jgi:hypothetical protein
MIDLVEAKRREQELFDQGTRWLEATNLIELLQPLGDVQLDGSFAYRLLVKPDIDFHIYNDDPDFSVATAIARKMLDFPDIVRFRMVNTYVNKPKPGEPKGHFLGLKLQFEDRLWTLDVWVIRPEDKNDSATFPPDWYKKLTPEQHDTILLIKHQLKEAGRYGGATGDKFASADVYRAVMNDGITHIDQLMEWRKTHPYF